MPLISIYILIILYRNPIPMASQICCFLSHVERCCVETSDYQMTNRHEITAETLGFIGFPPRYMFSFSEGILFREKIKGGGSLYKQYYSTIRLGQQRAISERKGKMAEMHPAGRMRLLRRCLGLFVDSLTQEIGKGQPCRISCKSIQSEGF